MVKQQFDRKDCDPEFIRAKDSHRHSFAPARVTELMRGATRGAVWRRSQVNQ